MSYYKKSDVKNHLSTGAAWPPASFSQRAEAADPKKDNSPDVRAGTPDAPELNPVSPPQKES